MERELGAWCAGCSLKRTDSCKMCLVETIGPMTKIEQPKRYIPKKVKA